MPAFSPSIQAGRLARWLVKEGDAVAPGDLLAEVEIDKTTVEIQAEKAGSVGRIIVPEDSGGIEGDTLLALLLAEGEDRSALDETAGSTVGSDPPSAEAGTADSQVRAAYDPENFDFVPHSRMRSTVASRLTEAKASIPHFYIHMDCRLDALLDLRRDLNARPGEGGGAAVRISLNDFLVKALGLALMRTPAANVSWTGEGALVHRTADIGVAVAVEGGLFTPIVRDVQNLSLREVAREVRRLTERARRGVLSPDEYRGGSSTISNLGMYPVRRFTAVINPPQATILAVGQSEKRPVVRRGEIEIATMIGLSLSCDHRIVDGALGAQLLAAFKSFIEDHPEQLV